MTKKLSPAISLNEIVNIKPDLFRSHFLPRSSELILEVNIGSLPDEEEELLNY